MKKSTYTKLTQIIKEEIQHVLSEDDSSTFNALLGHLKEAGNQAAKLTGNPLTKPQKDKLGTYLSAIWEDAGMDPDEFKRYAFESTNEASAKNNGSGRINFKGKTANDLYNIIKPTPDALVYCHNTYYTVDIDDMKHNLQSPTIFGLTKDGTEKEFKVSDIEYIETGKMNEAKRTESWFNIGINRSIAPCMESAWKKAGISNISKDKSYQDHDMNEVSFSFKNKTDHSKALAVAKELGVTHTGK